jgi:hypothetical protein
VISDLDIWRAANLLIGWHRVDAELEAARTTSRDNAYGSGSCAPSFKANRRSTPADLVGLADLINPSRLDTGSGDK